VTGKSFPFKKCSLAMWALYWEHLGPSNIISFKKTWSNVLNSLKDPCLSFFYAVKQAVALLVGNFAHSALPCPALGTVYQAAVGSALPVGTMTPSVLAPTTEEFCKQHNCFHCAPTATISVKAKSCDSLTPSHRFLFKQKVGCRTEQPFCMLL
jgi:hypothetical protein